MQTRDAHAAADQVGEPCFVRLIERIKDGDEIALESLMTAFVITLRRMVDLDSLQRPQADADNLIQSASKFLSHGLRTGQLEVTAAPQLVQAAARYLTGTSQRIATPDLATTLEGDLFATMSDRPLTLPGSRETDEQIRCPMKFATEFGRWIFQLFPHCWHGTGH